MFIECYRVSVNDWSKKANELKRPENKILVPIDRIEYIQTSPQHSDRAEIMMSADRRLHVLGSYEDILGRIINLGQTSHIMKRLGE
tara:strand:- start:142 stop:399 length:258 start_codon:yes stop_codon:yes gene_type:complete